MSLSGGKIAIIGTGAVGSTTAFSMIAQGICTHLVLIDVNRDKAIGEAMDLSHGMEYMNRNVCVKAGSFEDCGDADIVVITAAASRDNETDRLNMLSKTASIVKSIVASVMKSGFNGHFLVVSNPVDVISYYVYKLSGLPRNRVIGTGTALESARLRQIIGEIMNIDPRSVHAYSIGEHGDSQMIPWSHVRVGGKSFTDILADNPERFSDINLKNIEEKTTKAGLEVLQRKGNTQYGIASAATAICTALLHDENRMFTVSTLLEGEYGAHDVFCGVPAIIDKSGVKDIGIFHLTDDERKKFDYSVNILKNAISRLPE